MKYRLRLGTFCLLIALAVLWATTTPRTQTLVSGTLSSDTTWQASQSPIQVAGRVTIPAGVVLTIEPGVVVEFAADTSLRVDGTLVARGTSAAPIYFTSVQEELAPGQWEYVAFSDTSADASYDALGNYVAGSVLEHVVVEGAGESDELASSWAVEVRDATPLFTFVTIRTNRGTGLDVELSANDPQTGPMKILDSVITGNDGGVAVDYPGHVLLMERNWIHDNAARAVSLWNVSASGDAHLRANTITDNSEEGVYALGGPGVLELSGNTLARNLAGLVVAGSTTTTVAGNLVQGNGPAGGMYIEIGSGGSVAITGNAIIENQIDTPYSTGGHGAGLALNGAQDGVATVTNNIISDNVAAQSAGGVLLYGRGGNFTLADNVISGNVAPTSSALGTVFLFYQDGTASPVTYELLRNTVTQNAATDTSGAALSLELVDVATINHNNIFNNSSTYALEYLNPTGAAPLDATDNWWGTIDSEAIAGVIHDAGENPSLAAVDASAPWASANVAAPVSPPSGLTAAAGAATLALQWAANPEGDVAGYQVYYGSPSDPYGGTWAAEGASPIDVGSVTTFTLTGLPAGARAATVTAYDVNRDDVTDQTDGNESWYARDVVVLGTPTITWTPATPVVYGTPLDGSHLNATSDVDGTFAYSPAAGTVL